jgi:hypothetical protein
MEKDRRRTGIGDPLLPPNVVQRIMTARQRGLTFQEIADELNADKVPASTLRSNKRGGDPAPRWWPTSVWAISRRGSASAPAPGQ